MKLLDVDAVLRQEIDIQQVDAEREVLKELDDNTTSYAILSHRWGVEVGYKEMTGLMKMEERKRDEIRQRAGYQKIIESCKLAVKDGYEWLWIDTCCIDKRSSSELSEAINSMYRWYQNAQVCYAYLNDVGESTFPDKQDDKFDKSNGWPEWFVRGWTLQELIAPKQVEFFNKDWVHIGNKQRLEVALSKITGIPPGVLTSGLAGKRLSVAQIMSWAAERRTTRVEDRAYSLMGLFGVNMPMLYGEGKKAFRRLQLEIIREFSDHSIFAWNPRLPRKGSILAEDPSDFWDCGRVTKVEPGEFVNGLIKEYIERKVLSDPSRSGIDTLVALRDAVDSQHFHTFIVSNAGIQVFLPVVPFRDSRSHFRAILACKSDFRFGNLITIDLVSSGRSFARTSIDSFLPTTYPEFKMLYLIHHQDTNETLREFALDDEYALYHGFTRCGTYPRKFTSNSVTLSSLADDLVVIVYANNHARSSFAIGLGYYLGQEWVHVTDDRCSPTRGEDWTDFGRRAYGRMWKARAKHAQSMPKYEYFNAHHNDHFIKHAHLPRSIWTARVVWGRWEAGNSKVVVDVKQCPGCCDGPCGWTPASNNWTGPAMPGLMDKVSGSYWLESAGWSARVNKCFGQQIALGDYGDYSDDVLMCTGNIFEDMRAAGIDVDDSYCPTISSISGADLGRRMDWAKNRDDLAVAYCSYTSEKYLVLHQPKAISLSANEHISLRLKASSIRLARKHLVTTVIQCSDFYTVGEDGKQRDSDYYSAPDSGKHSTEAEILTPLCIIARPHFWSIEPLCKRRKERFKSIRVNFYTLVDMHQPTGTELCPKSANRQKKDIAIKFFSDLFGLKYLKNYIGDITFFARLPSMTETCTVGDVLSRMVYEDVHDNRKFAAAGSDPRLEAASLSLARWCCASHAKKYEPRQYADERERVEGEIESISRTLGADLLEHIRITFCNACREHVWSIEATSQARHITYDRQLIPFSVVQDIKALQAKLNATEDEDEQRALEEDVTGKILWLFWCGICAEVDELLLKVESYILRNMELDLEEFSCITPSTEPDDDQAHLQRIMLDAGANTSKYQLWLDDWATEQAKCSGTNKGTATIDNQAGSMLPHSLGSIRKRKLSELQGKDAGADGEVAITDTRRLRRAGSV